jgi:hypothetical protein
VRRLLGGLLAAALGTGGCAGLFDIQDRPYDPQNDSASSDDADAQGVGGYQEASTASDAVSPLALDAPTLQADSSLDAPTQGSVTESSVAESSMESNEAASQIEASTGMEASRATLPDGAVHDIPAGYAGMPFDGVIAQIPGTIFARNYDTGGQGVAFSHPGAINCSEWPNGMPMYRTGADCVGLSVEDSLAPDVTVDGGPADYGEIYLSQCSSGEWLKYTVEVLESGTYGISMSDAGPAITVLFSFSAMPVVTTGNLTVPQSVDQADSSQPNYHVWQNVNDIGTIDLPAGVYVMQFSIVYTAANFDSFTFTKM